MTTTTVTAEELEQRVAVLKHFRNLLTEQRSKFSEYLVVLEKQQASIEKDDAEAALTYCELETQIVDNLSALQRVIQPVETMYQELGVIHDVADIPVLQTDLSFLKKQVAAQNERNRALLDTHLTHIRRRIDGFKQITQGKSIYADEGRTAARIAIDI